MTIRSQYEGRCKKCGGRIHVGDEIEWQRGVKGVSHTICPQSPGNDAPYEPAKSNGKKRDWKSEPPSDKQRYWVERLLGEKLVNDELRERCEDLLTREDATKGQFSEVMDTLFSLPRKPEEDLPDVPAGRYALIVDGELQFVKVWKNQSETKTRCYDDDEWGHQYPLRETLEAIEHAGIGESAQLYGYLRAHCSRCGTRLENRLSVELGIGPVCGDKVFKPHEVWLSMKASAREEIRNRGEDPNESVTPDEAERRLAEIRKERQLVSA
jgi:DNA-directed RNA polymerase subunit RPC12/RpoP